MFLWTIWQNSRSIWQKSRSIWQKSSSRSTNKKYTQTLSTCSTTATHLPLLCSPKSHGLITGNSAPSGRAIPSHSPQLYSLQSVQVKIQQLPALLAFHILWVLCTQVPQSQTLIATIRRKYSGTSTY